MRNRIDRIAKSISIEASVPWKYCQDPQSGLWVAVCGPFKITLQADTYPELLESMAEALNEMFSDLAREDEIEDFLKEHGWRIAGTLPPKQQRDALSFDLPIQTNRVSASDLAEIGR
jgi:predicted RNase H-like HicB family nuclease